MRFKILMACLLASLIHSGCIGAGRMGIRFPDDPNATEITGPISFFCLREGALEGKPTNTLVCVDYGRYQRAMKELEDQIRGQLPSGGTTDM
jgi:hypothetical protein